MEQCEAVMFVYDISDVLSYVLVPQRLNSANVFLSNLYQQSPAGRMIPMVLVGNYQPERWQRRTAVKWLIFIMLRIGRHLECEYRLSRCLYLSIEVPLSEPGRLFRRDRSFNDGRKTTSDDWIHWAWQRIPIWLCDAEWYLLLYVRAFFCKASVICSSVVALQF